MPDTKSNKSQRESKIKLVTRWDYTEEASPAFKRLMALLLENKGGKRSDEQRDARKSPQ